MFAKRLMQLGGMGGSDGEGNEDKGGDELPPPGPALDLEGDDEANLRRSLVSIVVRVFCVGRLRSSAFPVNGESRSMPYEGYDSEDLERRLSDEIDSLLAQYLFEGNVEALRNFSITALSGSSEKGSSTSAPTFTVCGRLFKQQDVVYSCRDCALDNTCVLCATCFANSAHTTHNYRMHASGGGGYCDCGDIEAWRSDPACRLHTNIPGPSSEATDAPVAAPQVSPEVIVERGRSFLRYIIRFIEQVFTMPMDSLSADLHATFAKDYPTALSGWLTVLFNDEIHSFDEVIRTLRHAVGCSNSMAENFATLVDRKGRSIIFYARHTACVNASSRVTQRSAQENPKHMSLRVQASSFATFQLQELAVRMLDSILSRLLSNSPDLQRAILDALEAPCLSQPDGAEQRTVLDSLLLANSSMWKAARSSTHQFFMAVAFSLPECRRRFGFSYARNYSQIMGNFVEKDFHHYKDSIVSLSVQLLTVPSLVAALVEQLDFVVKIACAIRAAIEPAISNETDPATGVSREILDTSKLQSMARTLPSPYAFAAHDFRYVLRSLPPEPPLWSTAIEEAVLRGFVAFVHQVMKPFTGTDSLTRRVGEHVEWDPVLTNAFAFFDSVHPALFLFYHRLVCLEKPDRLTTALSLVRPTLEASLRSLNCFAIQEVKLELRRVSDKASGVLSPPKQRRSEHSDPLTNDIEILLSLQLPPVTIDALCNSHNVTIDPVSLHNGVPRVIYDLMGGAATLGIQPWYALCGGLPEAPSYGELKPLIVMEPALRVIVYQAQVQAGMWRRNGLAVAQQVAFYRHHSETCHQFDLDLLAIQLAAIAPGSSPDQFLVQLLDKFGLTSWLANSSSSDFAPTPQKQQKQMSDIITRYGTSLIDEMLLLLINILMERYRPGVGHNVKERECLRYRLVQRLATGAQPHSQLREWLLSHNDDSDAETELESLLADLAETRSRPTDGRTLFDLKPTHLDEFNPFTTCLERTELSRAEQHVREGISRQLSRSSAAASGGGAATPAPVVIVPSKLPHFTPIFRPLLNILSSPVFIEIVRVVLLKTLRRDNSLHQDLHVDKVLFLLAIVAIEQRRDDGGLGKRFSDIPETASLLSTLVQLHQQGAGGSQTTTTPTSAQQRGSSAPQPGELSRSQQDLIAWLVAELVPAARLGVTGAPPSVSAKAEEGTEEVKQKKGEIALQHRSKLMAKMAKLQRNFLESHPELVNIAQVGGQAAAAPVPMETSASPMETAEESLLTANIIQQMFDSSCKDAVCMVCQDVCRPAVIVRSSTPSQHIVVPGGSAPETAATSSPIACFVACMQRCYVLAQKNMTTQSPSIYMSVCGHNIHSYCWQRYTESQQARPRHRFLPGVLAALFGGSRGQPLTNAIAPCPLCESLGNAVIPLVDVRSFLPSTAPLTFESSQPSVLGDACKLLLSLSDPDERDYHIVSNHRTSSTLTSPFSGSTGNAVSNAVTAYGRTIANVLIAQAAAQLAATGSNVVSPLVPLKTPASPDELVRFVAMAIAHTGRCVVAVMQTFNPLDIADESSVFTGAVRRHLDCLIAASQAGVATSLLAADSFCAVNILRIISSNILNSSAGGNGDGDAAAVQFTAPPFVDSGELLAHLWLLEPIDNANIRVLSHYDLLQDDNVP